MAYNQIYLRRMMMAKRKNLWTAIHVMIRVLEKHALNGCVESRDVLERVVELIRNSSKEKDLKGKDNTDSVEEMECINGEGKEVRRSF